MKHLTCPLLCLGLLACSVGGADESKAARHEVEAVKNVSYNDARDADDVRHKLDMYLPRGAKDYLVIFFIHGGAWRGGKKDSFAAHGKTFAERGVGFVAINYRLSPAVKHPAHIEDVARAFAFSVKELGKRGANVKQIYVSGHSAGGHLAALLGSDESHLRAHKRSLADIKGVIPISGVFRVGGDRMKDVFGDAANGKQASPLTHARAGLPPFLIFYADKELGQLGKQAEEFGKVMRGHKAAAEVKMIKDRDHGTIMRHIARPDDEVTTAILAFITKNGGLPKGARP